MWIQVVIINVVEDIQRNRNAFAILAENKRVDIAVVAIADNIVKNNYINMLPQSLETYLYYIILYRHII